MILMMMMIMMAKMMMMVVVVMMITSSGGGENISCFVWGPGEKVSCKCKISISFIILAINLIIIIIWEGCASLAAQGYDQLLEINNQSGLVALTLLGFSTQSLLRHRQAGVHASPKSGLLKRPEADRGEWEKIERSLMLDKWQSGTRLQSIDFLQTPKSPNLYLWQKSIFAISNFLLTKS